MVTLLFATLGLSSSCPTLLSSYSISLPPFCERQIASCAAVSILGHLAARGPGEELSFDFFLVHEWKETIIRRIMFRAFDHRFLSTVQMDPFLFHLASLDGLWEPKIQNLEKNGGVPTQVWSPAVPFDQVLLQGALRFPEEFWSGVLSDYWYVVKGLKAQGLTLEEIEEERFERLSARKRREFRATKAALEQALIQIAEEVIGPLPSHFLWGERIYSPAGFYRTHFPKIRFKQAFKHSDVWTLEGLAKSESEMGQILLMELNKKNPLPLIVYLNWNLDWGIQDGVLGESTGDTHFEHTCLIKGYRLDGTHRYYLLQNPWGRDHWIEEGVLLKNSYQLLLD